MNAFLLAVCSLSAIAAAPPPNSTGRHVVAFASNGQDGLGQRGGLFVMRDDGTQVRQLTRFSELDLIWTNDPRNPLPDDQPSISPDGRKIAFTSNRAGNFDIWVMEINGGNLKQLTTSSARDVDPAWSPDGQFIAYASDQGSSELKIWQMRADGSEKTRITAGSEQDVDPAWHPNGAHIVFSRKVGLNNFDVFLLRRSSPTSSSAVELRLTNRAGEDRFPTFTPDGTRLVYTSERAFDLQTPYGHIVSSRFSESTPLGVPINLTDDNQRLGDFRRGGAAPAFSPDGTKLIGINSAGLLITSKQQLMRLTTTGAAAPTAARLLVRPFDLNINPSYGWELDTDGDGRPDHLEIPNLLLSAADFVRKRQAGNFPSFASHIAFPDLDHDGIDDLAILGAMDGGVDEPVVFLAGGSRLGPVIGSNAATTDTQANLSPVLRSLDLGTGLFTSFENLVAGDFNGDGFKDLVLVGGRTVVALGGSGPFQNFSEPFLGSIHSAQALVTGDFNRDGKQDLVVSAPNEFRLRAPTEQPIIGGEVRFHFGSRNGVEPESRGLLESVSTGFLQARLGTAMVVGDFNHDGVDDLAVSAPNQPVLLDGGAQIEDVGSVYVVRGEPDRLTLSLVTEIPAATVAPALGETPRLFGASLAAGDFDGDGTDELVVGIPTCLNESGAIAVYDPVHTDGTVNSPKLFLNPDGPARSLFGSALQVGDFSGDGVDDLAIAAPGSDKVWLYFGSRRSVQCVRCLSGLTQANRQALTADQFGLNPADSALLPNLGESSFAGRFPGPFPNLDGFESLTDLTTLAAGDINHDGQSDLAIGVPLAQAFADERLGELSDFILGVVCVRPGSKVGTFALDPRIRVAVAETPMNVRLVWRHPEQWRLLHDIHVRFVDEAGIWAWAKFNEETSTLSLYDDATGDFGSRSPVGTSQILNGPDVQIDLARASLVGSGNTGLELIMNLPVQFTRAAAGHRLRVEVFATDDRGGSQGWQAAGDITILPPQAKPRFEVRPKVGLASRAGVSMSVSTAPGQRIRIEKSTDLISWSLVRELDSSTGDVSLELPFTEAPRQFFRAVVP